MPKLVQFALEGGGHVLVQVDEQASGPVPAAAPGEVAAHAAQTFQQATSQLRPIATAILNQVKDLGPQDIQVEFSIKFSAAAGIILAQTAAEGTCKITLGWKRTAAEEAKPG